METDCPFRLCTPLMLEAGMQMCVCGLLPNWDFPERDWPTHPKEIRREIEKKAMRKLWKVHSPRLQYYMRDVNPMKTYGEQEYSPVWKYLSPA